MSPIHRRETRKGGLKGHMQTVLATHARGCKPSLTNSSMTVLWQSNGADNETIWSATYRTRAPHGSSRRNLVGHGVGMMRVVRYGGGEGRGAVSDARVRECRSQKFRDDCLSQHWPTRHLKVLHTILGPRHGAGSGSACAAWPWRETSTAVDPPYVASVMAGKHPTSR